jgi:uncharacterized protein with GYD domain
MSAWRFLSFGARTASQTPLRPVLRRSFGTTKRAEAFKNLAKQLGCTVKEIYWTQGQYDAVTILEAPDEAAATALARLGNIRTNTLRAFTATELAPILDKVV